VKVEVAITLAALAMLVPTLLCVWVAFRARAKALAAVDAAPASTHAPVDAAELPQMDLVLVHFDGREYHALWELGRKRVVLSEWTRGTLRNETPLLWDCDARRHAAPTHALVLAIGTDTVMSTGTLSGAELCLETNVYQFSVPRGHFKIEDCIALGKRPFADAFASLPAVPRVLTPGAP
jgi:hypothetical protein